DVFGNDGKTVIDTGKVTGMDNQVDQTTGTVKIKAEFPNANYQLWPGQFVNVRLKVQTLDKAIVVPTAAVQRGPAGTFVYVIGNDNIVTAR
ncbi:multidrug transporter subunit MdtA, partial [Serratia marcescens]|nr:multidrug transporter subunit MdtA [Serratia marcescens]